MNWSSDEKEKVPPNSEIRQLEQAVAADPSDIDSEYTLGALLAESGRHTEAYDRFSHVIELDPTCHEAIWFRGVCLHRMKKLVESIAELELAVSMSDHGPEYFASLGDVLVDPGMPERAKHAYETALSKCLPFEGIIERIHQALSKL